MGRFTRLKSESDGIDHDGEGCISGFEERQECCNKKKRYNGAPKKEFEETDGCTWDRRKEILDQDPTDLGSLGSFDSRSSVPGPIHSGSIGSRSKTFWCRYPTDPRLSLSNVECLQNIDARYVFNFNRISLFLRSSIPSNGARC